MVAEEAALFQRAAEAVLPNRVVAVAAVVVCNALFPNAVFPDDLFHAVLCRDNSGLCRDNNGRGLCRGRANIYL